MVMVAFHVMMVLTVAIACERPKAPLNSGEFYSSATFVNGTTVNYVCDPGYTLLGQQRRTCSADGTWDPPGLPVCVADVAIKKPTAQSSTRTMATSDVVRFRQPQMCMATNKEVMPWWFVDLRDNYRVQVIRASLEVNSSSPASLVFRVGEDSPSKSTNYVCSKMYDVLTINTTRYLPCTEVLVGRYVSIHVESTHAVSLRVCNVSVYSDRVAPMHVVGDVTTTSAILEEPAVTVPVMIAIVMAVATVVFLSAWIVVSCTARYRARHAAKRTVNQGVSSSASTDSLSSDVPNPARIMAPQLRSLVYTSSLPRRNVKSSGEIRQGAGRKMGRSVFTISETELRTVRLGRYNESPLL